MKPFYIQNQEFLGKWYLDGLLLTQRQEINEKFDEVCTQNLLTKSVPVNVATIFIEELNINGPDIFIYLDKW